ncbi:helix-turn-helix domain-containing protein [Lewinella sp. IMCC34191]|uniref:helix-turn-helix domain-containing protein n=1 Tax=Lewinella sp. IMCC34191 TaxID=2259172 RepID=UPI000E21FDAA|nr:AraC family transcriptional regulator [Lewinella sp. IMCC34191]
MLPPFFDFNLYSSLLLVGVAQGTVYATILAIRAYQNRSLSDGLAVLVLLVVTLYVAQWMLGFGGWYDARDWRTTLMFYVPWDNLLLLGPLIYLYFRAVTDGSFRWSNHLAWHFLPWSLAILPHLVAIGYDLLYLKGITGQALPKFFGTRGPLRESFWLTSPTVINAVTTFQYVQLTLYLAWTTRAYRRFRNYIHDAFSDPQGRSFTGLASLLVIVLAGVGMTMVIAGYQSVYGQVPYVKEWFHHLALSGVAFAAGIQFMQVDGDRIGSLRFQDLTEGKRALDERSTVPAHLEVIFEHIQRRMEQDHDYLEPDLRLAELGERIDKTEKQVSAAINACAGQNYNDYINGLRCTYFVALLQQGAHRERTLLALALEAGFNSKSTFNRAFRKSYGCSPKQVIERLEGGQNVSQKMI